MEKFGNNASTTLNGTITSGAASLVVTSATGFPTTGNFRILVDSGGNLEYMIVTAVSGTTFTITRGAEGTTGVSHTSGVQVVQVVTAYGASNSGWTTISDIDFSAGSNVSFTTDTTYTTVGGTNPSGTNYTWTKGNSANEATHAQIINGTGLQFAPASTSDYNAATRTLPYLWLPMSQVFPASTYPNFGWNTKIRMWVAISDNSASNYDNSVWGIDSNSTNLGVITKHGVGTVGNGIDTFWNINAANVGFLHDGVTLASYLTFMVDWTDGIYPTKIRTWRMGSISAGTAFPVLGNNFTPGVSDVLSTSASYQMSAIGVVDPFAGMGFLLGSQRAGSGTSMVTTFKRLRIDAKFDD
jgi:hypothetical protein